MCVSILGIGHLANLQDCVDLQVSESIVVVTLLQSSEMVRIRCPFNLDASAAKATISKKKGSLTINVPAR